MMETAIYMIDVFIQLICSWNMIKYIYMIHHHVLASYVGGKARKTTEHLI